MKVARWGHALAVRLPAALVEQLGLREGDDITLAPNRYGALDVAFAQRHERSAEWMSTPERGIPIDILESYLSGELTRPPAPGELTQSQK